MRYSSDLEMGGGQREDRGKGRGGNEVGGVIRKWKGRKRRREERRRRGGERRERDGRKNL